ncbi:MAG TPA: hypothetical protein VGF71_15330 [Caulobacteraceae bacterium]|jgi:hypothetical protein
MRQALLAALFSALALPPPAAARDVIAGPPRALSVTLYRAPWRQGGSIELGNLGGFALIKETRTVHLPAGDSRLRFEGVVDGIQSASAIVTGLPEGVIEKNRDAAILSPAALMRAAIGVQITLVRTNRKTGKITRTPATIRSADENGVVFETTQGVEALRCSGLPETFTYDRVPAGLFSTPTLSVLTRAKRETTATVTLSYLADNFDWAANYVATLTPDRRALDLTAWITLANGNSVSLLDAGTQIVAGRLNRARDYADSGEGGPRVIATCWPTGTTSIPIAEPPPPEQPRTSVAEIVVTAARKSVPMAMMAPAPPPPPPPEQLGDLKLYRLGERTTVAARQSKQVLMLSQAAVPFTRTYGADLYAGGQGTFTPATIILRTRNDKANHLGLPLPAGHLELFDHAGNEELLAGQADVRDTAEGEDVELKVGLAPDVQVRQTRLAYRAGEPELTFLTPELLLALHKGRVVEEAEITNAGAAPAPFELRLQTWNALHVSDADQPMGMKDGRPIFRLTVPANGRVKVRYAVGGP